MINPFRIFTLAAVPFVALTFAVPLAGAGALSDGAKAQPRAVTRAAPPRARAEAPSRDQPPPSSRTQTSDRDRRGDHPVAVPREGVSRRSTEGESRRSAPPPAGSVSESTADRRWTGGTGGDGGAQAVPRGSRERGTRPAIGMAIPRGDTRRIFRPTVYPYYSPFAYYPYPYGAFGLGYFYYDPFWWGPSAYGYGYPGAYGYGYPVYGGYQSGDDVGGLRLKVKPRDAQVLVDGYYAGVVNDFDGVFQRLNLDAGPHRIEIRAPGFDPLVFEIRIQPGETVTYRGALRPLRP